jgi:hypothetical protein
MAAPIIKLTVPGLLSVENVDNLTIVSGKSFTLDLSAKDGTELPVEGYRVFSDNDQVLSITVRNDGKQVDVTTASAGQSTLQFQKPGNGTIEKVFEVVVAANEAVGATVTSQGVRPRDSE